MHWTLLWSYPGNDLSNVYFCDPEYPLIYRKKLQEPPSWRKVKLKSIYVCKLLLFAGIFLTFMFAKVRNELCLFFSQLTVTLKLLMKILSISKCCELTDCLTSYHQVLTELGGDLTWAKVRPITVNFLQIYLLVCIARFHNLSHSPPCSGLSRDQILWNFDFSRSPEFIRIQKL